MSTAAPISDDELAGLFRGLERTPLALAVSGGADSMALMHMVARWARRPEVAGAYRQAWLYATDEDRRLHNLSSPVVQWTGLERPSWLPDEPPTLAHLRAKGGVPHVVILTVDHGLRAEAAAEAAFVAKEATRLGFVCEVLRWEGDKPATGIQDAARQARRNLMLDVLRAECGILNTIFRKNALYPSLDRALVMAHHLEDQAETVLMRLGRGSGLEGLGGMRPRGRAVRAPVAERPEEFSATVFRPLFDASKVRLVATLEAYGARWVEDPSNEDDRFERVRVRRMLAQLGEVGLSPEKISLSARRLRDADEAMRRRGAFAHSQEASCLLMPHLGDVATMADWYAAPYLYVRTLRWLMRIYGGAARPAELSQIEQLAFRLSHETNASLFAGMTLGGCKIELATEKAEPGSARSGIRIRIYREGSGNGLPVASILPGQSVDWDGGRFRIVAQECAKPGAVIRALGMQGWVEVKRLVPGFESLRLPAAAVATLPVVADAATGGVISYCGLDCVLNQMRKPGSEKPDEDAVPALVWQSWQDATALPGRDYFALFDQFSQHW